MATALVDTLKDFQMAYPRPKDDLSGVVIE